MEGLGEFPRSALNLVIAFLLEIPIGLERERHPGVGTAAAYELYPLAVLLSASSEADDAGTPCSVRTRRPGSEPSLLRGERPVSADQPAQRRSLRIFEEEVRVLAVQAERVAVREMRVAKA